MYFHRTILALVAACAALPAAAEEESIYDTAKSEEDFSTLVAAIDAAGLADTLLGPGPFTVFAPFNEAFDALPDGLVTQLLKPEWKPQLVDLLLYHALSGKVMSTDLKDGLEPEALNGESLLVNLEPPRINNVTLDLDFVDVGASNGVIHVPNAVLTPRSVTSNIVQIGQSEDDFSTLVAAVVAADLAEILSGPGPFTLFAPTNEAFGKIDSATLTDLLEPENKDKLANILKYHVVSGNIDSSKVTTGDVTTLSGDDVSIVVSGEGDAMTVKVNDANVIDADVLANNGIIHVLDTVLMPPSDPVPADPTTSPAPTAAPVGGGGPSTASPVAAEPATTAPTDGDDSGAAAGGALAAALAVVAGTVALA